MSGTQAELGVYIHYPWCRRLCPYCDFAVAVARKRPIPQRAYLDAVLAELADRAPELAGRRLVSIYFGGGTPSLWPADCLAQVIAAVGDAFPGAAPAEVTLEANPVDCTADALAGWRRIGITRVSIGVQSLDPGELVTLGRDHGQGDGRAAVLAAAAAGLSSFSADAIIGVPGGAPGAAEPSVTALAALGPPHLSVYELTIEARTRFGHQQRRGELHGHGDELLADKLAWVHHRLEELGYQHYEVSSYARPGHRAIHNALYWSGAEYLGLGCGAASFRRDGAAGLRWSNTRAAGRYLRSRGGERVTERVELTAEQVAEDALWLGMRTSDGVSEAALAGRPRVRDGLVRDGLARAEGGRIRPTLRGFLHADEIARRLVAAPRSGIRTG